MKKRTKNNLMVDGGLDNSNTLQDDVLNPFDEYNNIVMAYHNDAISKKQNKLINKILKRSLKNNATMMKKYEFFIDITNGNNMLYIYLTQAEIKQLITTNEYGLQLFEMPYYKIDNLFKKYDKMNEQGKLLEVENLIGRTDISDDVEYEIYFDNTNSYKIMNFRDLKLLAKSKAKIISSKNNFEYSDDFAQFFTKDEFDKINNNEIIIFLTANKILLVSAY